MEAHEQCEDFDHTPGPNPSGHVYRQTFPRELVDDAQHAICLSIVGPVRDKVVRPDMVGALRPETDARSVVEPESTTLTLFAGDL